MTTINRVAELRGLVKQDGMAAYISELWDRYQRARSVKLEEWKELRNFIFQIDTTKTNVGLLPHSNTTTRPKICQIRDNLLANYISALFPNDDWLKWQAYSQDAAVRQKAKTIESYMANKTREGGFRKVVGQLLDDYVTYGNAIAMPTFEANYRELANGDVVPSFIGPKAVRISPLDIVFDPLASDFKSTWKIVRSLKTSGEIAKIAKAYPEQEFWKTALDRRHAIKGAGYGYDDFNKVDAYAVDGFGSLTEYYNSDTFEVLEFYGDWHSDEDGLHTNRVITVIDRATVVRNIDMPSWFGTAPIYHVGWRARPDNMWAMGALDNLVGMQYRIDHLENAKADAIDLSILPPLKVIGDVNKIEWKAGGIIHIDGEGDVQEMGKNLNGALMANQDIQMLQMEMERMAGAPSEAMGVRSAGEKTAFEVQQLQNAAGRIFQEKVTLFETELLEPLLNAMLETAVRNMDGSDIIRVSDDMTAFDTFLEITKDDITANGVLRPVGARHFGKQAQDLQNLMGLMNSPMGQMIAPHISAKALTKFAEDVSGLKGYDVFAPHVAIAEQFEMQKYQQDLAEEAQMEAEVQRDAADAGIDI